MKAKMLGEVEEQRRSDPMHSLVFIASVLFPHDTTDQREGGNAATFVLEFMALTSAVFMQERNVWARQVKHLLALSGAIQIMPRGAREEQ